MSRTAEINVFVELDDDNLPTRISWQATEAKSDEPVPCRSLMLSVWESENRATAAIDLWTADTTIEEMNMHFYQTFHKMGDTYLRATQNPEAADLIHEFGERFGAALGLKVT